MRPELGEAQIAVALIGEYRHDEQLNPTELIPCLYRRQQSLPGKNPAYTGVVVRNNVSLELLNWLRVTLFGVTTLEVCE